IVCSLTLCFLAVSATDVRSASRSTATICSSLNRLFLMGSSLSKSHLHRNYWSEETGQVKTSIEQPLAQESIYATLPSGFTQPKAGARERPQLGPQADLG